MKKRNQKPILIILLVIVVFFILATLVVLSLTSLIIVSSLTGDAISNSNKEQYIHTKALCNNTNYCQDYQITCSGNQTLSIKPITGSAVQYSENWQDPRETGQRTLTCG